VCSRISQHKELDFEAPFNLSVEFPFPKISSLKSLTLYSAAAMRNFFYTGLEVYSSWQQCLLSFSDTGLSKFAFFGSNAMCLLVEKRNFITTGSNASCLSYTWVSKFVFGSHAIFLLKYRGLVGLYLLAAMQSSSSFGSLFGMVRYLHMF
jgi:hypothetical protein